MKLKLRDWQISYDDTGGNNPSAALRMPLLLIHGFPLDRTYWTAQTRALGDVARVIAPDLRGFGESPLPIGAVTMDTYADDLRDLLDGLGVQHAVIAGLSMGGYIAFAFYRKYASRVRALILADTRAAPDSPEAKKGRDDNVALARVQGTGAVAERMFPKMLMPLTIAARADIANAARTLMSRQPVEGVIAALIALRDRPDSTPTLAQIAVPTLIVVGAEDMLTPPKDSEQMRDGVRGAHLEMIPNAAHLSNLEQPDAFNRAVRKFLQSIG
jgi:3-oxoadipate enol-lactonase